MTTNLKITREKRDCLKISLSPGKVEGLISTPRTIEQWANRYLNHFKSNRDYTFYDPDIGMRSYNDGHNGHSALIQDKKIAFFELDNHNTPNSEAIKKIIKIANSEPLL